MLIWKGLELIEIEATEAIDPPAIDDRGHPAIELEVRARRGHGEEENRESDRARLFGAQRGIREADIQLPRMIYTT